MQTAGAPAPCGEDAELEPGRFGFAQLAAWRRAERWRWMKVIREAGAGVVPWAQFAPETHDVSGQGQIYLIPPFVHALARSKEAHWELAAALQDPNPALAPRRAPRTPVPPPCPQPCHGSRPSPGTGSAASFSFLPEMARRRDFLPPSLPGAGVSAAIHHQSNREVSGTISERVVLTLSETIWLFLMKLGEEEKKNQRKSADNRCIISSPIYWHMDFSFMAAADMQIYSEWSRYSPQWINSCSKFRRKAPG